jgi:hypothetical protein
MKRWIFYLTVFLLLIGKNLSAQSDPEIREREQPKSNNRWIKGGNVGLWLGTFTFIQAAPFVGYRVTDKLTLGTGVDYTYVRDRRVIPADEFSIFGGNVFGRYNVSRELFIQGEYSTLSFPDFSGKRQWFSSPLIGGGYFPGRGAYVMAMWALNPDYPIANPIIRMGFMF